MSTPANPTHAGHDHAGQDHGWFAPIDAYCERVGQGLFAEPLNAVTNLAFVAGAVYLWFAAGKGAPPDARRVRSARTLAVLLLAIGLASGAFHTFANRLTAMLDSLSIVVFVTVFLVQATRSLLGWRFGGQLGVILAWLGASIGLAVLCPSLTCAYLPSVASAGLFGLVCWRTRRPIAKLFLLAAGVLVLSLALRSLDEPLCDLNPYGTHFLWHLCNAAALTLCGRALAKAMHQSAGEAGDKTSSSASADTGSPPRSSA
ncbi:MAG: ceramidase domain-containing protein [Planctomycetota bacterium]